MVYDSIRDVDEDMLPVIPPVTRTLIGSHRAHIKTRTYQYGIAPRGFKNLIVADEENWKHARSLVVGSFTKTKLKSMNGTIDSSATNLIAKMKEFSKSSKTFLPRNYVKKYALNIILGIAFSESLSYDEDVVNRLAGPIDETFKILASANPADFINILAPFYLAYKKFTGTSFDVVFKFAEEIYDEHVSTLNPDKPRDLFDSLIIDSQGKNKESVILIATDFILAGTDTSSSVIEWFLLFMINYPEVQQKCFGEIQSAVGTGNQVDLSHRINTPFVNAVIKETLRIRPVGPIGLPRVAKDTVVINGVTIPKGTQMILNHWSLHHDESYWTSPEEYIPERFLADNHTEHYLPFSLGSRNCIGENLAKDEIYVACANIILNFNLKSSTGKPVSDRECTILTQYSSRNIRYHS
eukprot:gene1205-1390_t